jgi:hypothetical protein
MSEWVGGGAAGIFQLLLSRNKETNSNNKKKPFS